MTTTEEDTTNNKTTISIRGMDCIVHKWNVDTDTKKKGIVVVYHGFLAHGKYPTVKYAAELLGNSGYSVIAVDMPGHGLSPGLRGYLPNAQTVINDGITIAKSARSIVSKGSDTNVDTLKLFLVGSSMGGAIALSVAQQMNQEDEGSIAGVALLAPMLALNVSSIEHTLLTGLAYIIPTLPLIPSSATSDEKQYRDELKRKECSEDKLTVSGSKLRISSALACVDITLNIKSQFNKITVPYLLQIAKEDVVVKNSGSYELYDQTPSGVDRTKKEYNALHGLLCEPKPLIDIIQNDLLTWIQQRS